MTADGAVAIMRSPLGATSSLRHVAVRGEGVEVAEIPFRAQVTVRLDPTPGAMAALAARHGIGLPMEPNRVAVVTPAGLRALWLGPDEWLIVNDDVAMAPADVEALVAGVVRPFGGSVVDVSAHRTQLELTGSGARNVLAAGCSVDLHPRVFAVGSCAQTLLARVDVIVERRPDDSFRVLVRTSFAGYLVDWLRDAMASDAGGGS